MIPDNVDLTGSPLFAGVEHGDANDILERCMVGTKVCHKGEHIVRQGDLVTHLLLPVSGFVRTEMITKEGNVVEIDFIEALRPLAPAFLFADRNIFPVDVIAAEETVVYVIDKTKLLAQMQDNDRLLLNFVRLTSNIAVFLSNKVQMMSIKSVKGKLALYILENTSVKSPSFKLTRTLTQLAEHFGVQRPSLSRTIRELVGEGVIEWDKKEIKVLSRFRLECMI
ncbi:Crp/Fnr family transcriptional regulator [Porphyromonas sp.]|uniref:Crp/Fnr family transcriptional regulator n=1 Tax=Porphyromonas sp. TaxID=1924944 RepID=UPI0026DC55EF|nr:Crp/Fnr family transcriptional regulator [Porphyromonas sp.]MDO4695563.1 Crp/Fnr family transcriptional regulator [Porphyromonas sp.]MDO4770519.1 Crp/Fnr family transcriptional regulator [Porphyromonas sp.]